MRRYWYLVATLPRIVLGQSPESSPAAFRARCGEHLVAADLAEFDAVLAGTGDTWTGRQLAAFEAALRTACARLRAGAAGGEREQPAGMAAEPDPSLARAVQDAFAAADPRARELALDRVRLDRYEELARGAPFSFRAVLAYGLSLRLAAAWAARTEAAGRAALAQHLDVLLAPRTSAA
jgi:hypothetical protein